MSASSPSGGRIAAENELLSQLGLPPSATPEDVDQLHLTVSQFLASAPASIRGWAHAQAAQLDAAYLSLNDPVGLEGPSLRSPTRPPTVAPGGPVTPPARRDPVPAAMPPAVAIAPTAIVADDVRVADAPAIPTQNEGFSAAIDDTDTDDIDALFASVTPGAHRDLTSGGGREKQRSAPVAEPPPTPRPANATSGATLRHARSSRVRPTPVVAQAPAASGPWKAVAIAVSAILAVVVVAGFVVPFVFNLGAAGAAPSSQVAQASPTAPAVDQAKVSALMAKLQANPKDTDSLQQLGDEFYQGEQYPQAATFYDQLLAIDPSNIKALLARGAVYFNLGDLTNAEKTWKSVVALKPTNKADLQEAHYDLGFLYLNQASPDWTGVSSEWQAVISIDSTSSLATLVQQHITSLIQASMIPASLLPSASPSASGAAPSGQPSSSAAPAGSVAPAAATPAPSASPAVGG